MHLVLPHERVTVEVDRVHPLQTAGPFPERPLFPVVAAGEALVVGWVYGPVAAAPVLRPVELKETVVEREGMTDAIAPTRPPFLERGEGFFHVLVYVGQGALTGLLQDGLSYHGRVAG